MGDFSLRLHKDEVAPVLANVTKLALQGLDISHVSLKSI